MVFRVLFTEKVTFFIRKIPIVFNKEKRRLRKMPTRQDFTPKSIYRMVVDLQPDVALIKKIFAEEPELHDDFMLRT